NRRSGYVTAPLRRRLRRLLRRYATTHPQIAPEALASSARLRASRRSAADSSVGILRSANLWTPLPVVLVYPAAAQEVGVGDVVDSQHLTGSYRRLRLGEFYFHSRVRLRKNFRWNSLAVVADLGQGLEGFCWDLGGQPVYFRCLQIGSVKGVLRTDVDGAVLRIYMRYVDRFR